MQDSYPHLTVAPFRTASPLFSDTTCLSVLLFWRFHSYPGLPPLTQLLGLQGYVVGARSDIAEVLLREHVSTSRAFWWLVATSNIRHTMR